MRATRFHAAFIACVLGLVISGAARPAAAETLSLLWDPNPNGAVAGYIVYIGTQPGDPANSYDVGTKTSFEWNGAIDGQQYYFSVASYSAGPIQGPRSPEISRYPNLAPTLANPGTQTTVKGSNVTLQLSGSDPEGASLAYGASGLPPGLQLVAGMGQVSGSPSTVGNYTVTATVTDGVQSAVQTFTWQVVLQAEDAGTNVSSPALGHDATPTQTDTHTAAAPTTNLPPVLTDPGPQTATSGIPAALQLSGKDPEGAAVSFGASGLPPGLQLTASTGRISGAVSRAGRYTVTATITDGVLSDVRTFAWTVLEPVTDTVAPVLTITIPTTGAIFVTTDQFVTIGGTAIDSGDVVSVTWSTDRGFSGAASGTDNWIAGVPIQPGANTVTVTARDQAGNVATRSIAIRTFLKASKQTPDTHGPHGRDQ